MPNCKVYLPIKHISNFGVFYAITSDTIPVKVSYTEDLTWKNTLQKEKRYQTPIYVVCHVLATSM